MKKARFIQISVDIAENPNTTDPTNGEGLCQAIREAIQQYDPNKYILVSDPYESLTDIDHGYPATHFNNLK